MCDDPAPPWIDGVRDRGIFPAAMPGRPMDLPGASNLVSSLANFQQYG